MTSAADAPDDGAQRSPQSVPDPWQDYTWYRDEDGMCVIKHVGSAEEWIACSESFEPPDWDADD